MGWPRVSESSGNKLSCRDSCERPEPTSFSLPPTADRCSLRYPWWLPSMMCRSPRIPSGSRGARGRAAGRPCNLRHARRRARDHFAILETRDRRASGHRQSKVCCISGVADLKGPTRVGNADCSLCRFHLQSSSCPRADRRIRASRPSPRGCASQIVGDNAPRPHRTSRRDSRDRLDRSHSASLVRHGQELQALYAGSAFDFSPNMKALPDAARGDGGGAPGAAARYARRTRDLR